jgi:hypothetical protein
LAPLIEVVQHDGHDQSDWLWVLGQYEQLFAQRQRYALLVDASRLTQSIEPKTRRIVTDWIDRHQADSLKWNVGTSVVMHSGLIRGAFTAMMWFTRPAVPLEFPATYAEALDWSVARLDDASLTVPFALRRRQVQLLGNVRSK